jgi:hypothetical protein
LRHRLPEGPGIDFIGLYSEPGKLLDSFKGIDFNISLVRHHFIRKRFLIVKFA